MRHAYTLYRSIQQDGSLVTTYTPWQQDNWYLYDALNRVTVSQGSLTGSRGAGTIDHGAAGTAITYDVAGQRKTATYAVSLPGQHWAYVGPSGQLASQMQQNLKNGSDSALADTNQTYGYAGWDGAMQIRHRLRQQHRQPNAAGTS